MRRKREKTNRESDCDMPLMDWLQIAILETQRLGLVDDRFVSNMRNPTLQKRISTKPKNEPEKALSYELAVDQGIQLVTRFCTKNVLIEDEPVLALTMVEVENVLNVEKGPSKWHILRPS